MTGGVGSAERGNALRIGFVGAGRATTTLHLPSLALVEGAAIAGVADPDREARERLAAQRPDLCCVADPRALLDDRGIDIIAVCTPVSSHVELALAALDADKHVFVEKPLALSLAECDRLLAAARRSSRQVMVGFNTRWHRFARRTRALLRAGAIGAPELVESCMSSHHREIPRWRERRATGGGVLLEMAIHHFDLWRFLLDAEVEEISAHARSGAWEDEAASVNARLAGGVLASGTFAERTTQQNRVAVLGRAGAIEASLYRFDGLVQRPLADLPGTIPSRIAALRRSLRELPRGLATLRRGGEWRLSYVEQWRHLVGAIRDGGRVECGIEEGRSALAVALAAVESAATGRAVALAGGAARAAERPQVPRGPRPDAS